MIENEQILELAKTCGFEEFIGERDDETDGVYYQFWEEQLLKFALIIHENGYNKGYNEGYESGSTGVFGEPLG
jgi:hypothetical protein